MIRSKIWLYCAFDEWQRRVREAVINGDTECGIVEDDWPSVIKAMRCPRVTQSALGNEAQKIR